MAGGIQDVDFDAFPGGAYVFRQDRNPALAFEVVVVQDQLTGFLPRIDGLALVDNIVHECSFTVVNVGDDGDVTDAVHELVLRGNRLRGAKNGQTFAEYYNS
mgnify:CR=1 FL=1